MSEGATLLGIIKTALPQAGFAKAGSLLAPGGDVTLL